MSIRYCSLPRYTLVTLPAACHTVTLPQQTKPQSPCLNDCLWDNGHGDTVPSSYVSNVYQCMFMCMCMCMRMRMRMRVRVSLFVCLSVCAFVHVRTCVCRKYIFNDSHNNQMNYSWMCAKLYGKQLVVIVMLLHIPNWRLLAIADIRHRHVNNSISRSTITYTNSSRK